MFELETGRMIPHNRMPVPGDLRKSRQEISNTA